MLLVVRPWPLKFQTFQGPKIREAESAKVDAGVEVVWWKILRGAIFVDGSRGDNWMFPKIGGKTPKMDSFIMEIPIF